MKKIASIVLAFVVAFSLCSHSILSAENVISTVHTTPSKQSASNGTCGENLTWTLDNEGTLTISGTGGMWTDYEYTNTSWYSNRSSVKKVVIQNGVTSIGYGAFKYCTNLTSVVIPDSVTSIGDSAFSHCESLTSVIIPDSVTSIGNSAFEGCSSLTSVAIPDSVTSIGNSAFANCSSLVSVVIPDSVTSISYDAFYGCSTLESITVDKNNNEYSNDKYGVLFNKDKTTLIQYPTGNKRTSYAIPNSVTSICAWAFYDCYNLTSVTIPNSVTNIDHFAFCNCSSLISVEIPDSVTSIGMGVFIGCSSIISVTIPDNGISIDVGAFSGCSSLISVTIPENADILGQFFFGCDSLTTITVDEKNDGLSSDMYGVLFNKDKSELFKYPAGNKRTTYIVPNGVTYISEQAFANCEYLTSITIPNSVTYIDYYAFGNCSNLENVYFTGSEEEWNEIYIEDENYPLLNATIHFNTFVPEVPELSEGSGYVVNEAVDAIVAKASAKGGESLEKFLTNITTDPECVRVVDADGNIQTSVTKLITGYKFQLLGPDGSVLKNYEIVILGDTDRNGRFSISDVSGVQSAVAAKPDKNTVEFLEANIDGNSRLSVTDASALQSFLANGTW